MITLAQLLPRFSAIETMAAESYFLLALWCLLGFIFYWRTMRYDASLEHDSETAAISTLFFLQFYAMMVWYIRKMLEIARTGGATSRAVRCSLVFALLVVLGLTVMLLILTRLRRRQAELESERIHAVASSRAKSQFLFNMSHDIRTPMNAIMGFAHLALKPGVSLQEKDDYLRKIDTSGQQLLGIINDVLDMSRIENGRLELAAEPVNLPDAFSEVEHLFATQMAKKGIDFTVDAADVRDQWVLSDKNRLNRVALNLLGNASKFTPEGGRVSVGLRQLGREGDRGIYELRVKDDGIGMSADFVVNVFTPFERERTSTVSGIQGTGLGLSITKGIVGMMGGDISVVTAPGEGAEFTVRLPLPVTQAPHAVEEEAAPEAAPEMSRARLLLVEDNAINMEIALMILTQAGFEVETAENGQIALDRVREAEPGHFSAVLMDIQMPVMDGYAATRAIRALEDPVRAATPIIAMTANAFREDERAAEAAGMQAHIAKPLDIVRMMATIQEVLAAHDRS